jgi:hypothetical protein
VHQSVVTELTLCKCKGRVWPFAQYLILSQSLKLSIPFQYVPELYSVELDEYSKGLEWAFLLILYCCPMLAEGELEEPDSHV